MILKMMINSVEERLEVTVVCISYGAKRVLKVDVVNRTTTMVGDSYDGDDKWKR